MNPSDLFTDTPNAIGNSLLVDPLVTLNATSGLNYINITESNARSACLQKVIITLPLIIIIIIILITITTTIIIIIIIIIIIMMMTVMPYHCHKFALNCIVCNWVPLNSALCRIEYN